MEVDDLDESGIGRVDRHVIWLSSSERDNTNFAVDVQQTLFAARRPDNSVQGFAIAKLVVVLEGTIFGEFLGALFGSSQTSFGELSTFESVHESYLLGLSGEPISGLALAAAALRNVCVATELRGEDAVLPSAGVLELDVQVAVLPVLLGGDTGSRISNEVGVGNGHGRLVVCDIGDGAVGLAAASTVADTQNLDFMAAGANGAVTIWECLGECFRDGFCYWNGSSETQEGSGPDVEKHTDGELEVYRID